MAERTLQVPASLLEALAESLAVHADNAYCELNVDEDDERNIATARALLSQSTPTAEASGTDVLAADEEMTEYGEAERLRVPTAEDAANALRAEGWDRAYDDLERGVKFPNRNPFRDVTPPKETP